MPTAVPTMPDSASGRVDDPVLAEVLLQAVGDPEDAAELADVLAHEEDLGVVLHRLAQAHVEALGQRDLLRRCSSSVRLLEGRRGTPRSRRAGRRARRSSRRRRGRRCRAAAGRAAPCSPRAGGGRARRPRPRRSSKNSSSTRPLRRQVDLDALDRVLELPVLERRRRAGSGSGRRSWCARPSGRCRPRRASGPGRRGRAAARPASRRTSRARRCRRRGRRGSRSRAPAGRAGSGSGARSARRSPTGCSGRRRRRARCRTRRR